LEYDLIKSQLNGSLALHQQTSDSRRWVVQDTDFREPCLVAFGRANDSQNLFSGPTRAELVRLATQIHKLRQARSRFLSSSLFGEPAWDMMLALYCLPPGKPNLSVSKLCYAAGVPGSTALRWTQILEANNLIRRSPDPCDRRRFFVTLSTAGEEFMSRSLRPAWHELMQIPRALAR
jgi:DNA-binding MarR family transcriptional regulator